MNFLNIYKHKIIVACTAILVGTFPVFSLQATTTTEREERVRFSSLISPSVISLLGVTATTTNEGNSPHSRYIDIALPYTNIFTNIHGTTTITATTTYSPYTGHVSNNGSISSNVPPINTTYGSTTENTSTVGTSTSTTSTSTTNGTSTIPTNDGGITISAGSGTTTQTIGGSTSGGGGSSSNSSSGGGSGSGGGFTPMNLGDTTTSPLVINSNPGEVLGASVTNEDLFGIGGGDPEFANDILGLPNTGYGGDIIYMYLLILSLMTIVITGLLLRRAVKNPKTLFFNL